MSRGKTKLFQELVTPAVQNPSPGAASSCIIVILRGHRVMGNGQWKKGGEPRTSTHRFV